MEALSQPSMESEEEEVGGAIVRDQLLPGLRSFCSALKGVKIIFFIKCDLRMNTTYV